MASSKAHRAPSSIWSSGLHMEPSVYGLIRCDECNVSDTRLSGFQRRSCSCLAAMTTNDGQSNRATKDHGMPKPATDGRIE
jgi:hypothetical protein